MFILNYQMVCANITALGGSWNVNIPGPAGTIPWDPAIPDVAETNPPLPQKSGMGGEIF